MKAMGTVRLLTASLLTIFSSASIAASVNGQDMMTAYEKSYGFSNNFESGMPTVVMLEEGPASKSRWHAMQHAHHNDLMIATGPGQHHGNMWHARERDRETERSHLSAIPVPASVWLFVSGLLGLIAISRRRGHSA